MAVAALSPNSMYYRTLKRSACLQVSAPAAVEASGGGSAPAAVVEAPVSGYEVGFILPFW